MSDRKLTRAELRVERDEARAFADQLLNRRVLTCVYCGHEYPQNTPAAGSAVLTEHIAVCEKHPMRGFVELLTEAAGLLEENGLLGQMSHRFQAWRFGGVAPTPSAAHDPCPSKSVDHLACVLSSGHRPPHRNADVRWIDVLLCAGKAGKPCPYNYKLPEGGPRTCSECATEGPV